LLDAQVDTLVLGCTHYPLLRETLQKVLGPDVLLVDSAEETARSVATLFAEQGLERPEHGGKREFFVTDVPTRFERVGKAFLGRELLKVEQVRIG
jgi:glutamate racemase